MAAAPLLLIAAGGTGGHMFPAQALAEAMIARGWRVKLSTDARGARYAGNFPPEVVVEQVASSTFARGGIVAKAATPFRIAGGVASAVAAMFRDRPAVIVGFGGYPTIPALSAGLIARVPLMIHEQNGVLGRVNRAFARKVAVMACGTWPTALPEGTTSVHTGNPVRAAILERAAAPYIPPGDYPMSLLVIGGSQGARILSDVVPAGLAALPEPMRRNLRIAHQARPEDLERVVAAYESAGLDAEVAPFFTDMPRRLTEAQLVIARAGASTVAELAVIGRPAILVPFAQATGDHQTANARGMVEAGGAILIPEQALDADTLAGQVAAVLGTPGAGMRMSHGALSRGIPDATERLAALVEELATRKG